MAYSHYERLSALDSMFLDFEDVNVHMHVGAVAVLDAGPLQGEDGHLDFDRVGRHLEAALHVSPRFRQKLATIPAFEHPVWIDDERFNLAYHLRHTCLPRPGGTRQLKRLAGRILSQKLDRGKPLWEMWIVEGVEEGRIALIVKAHHCMVDGVSGLDLLAGIMRLDPDPTVEPAPAWLPRPAPPRPKLLADELLRRASWPALVARAGRRAVSDPRSVWGDLQEGLFGLGEILKVGLKPTSSTPLNADIGPHRRFDWTGFELSAVKEVRARLGGTVNDVVLACAAGAIGEFLRRRGLRPGETIFRAQVPVSLRGPGEHGQAGNRVVMLLAELPVDETDPIDRLHRVIATTRRLKGSRQRRGVEFLEELSDRTLTSIFLAFARLAAWQRSFNVVVTNVPGPQIPVYLLGARMREIYPLVPLAANQGLGIALFSYDGRLSWGLNADWETVPDLHDLVLGLEREFEALCKAALPSA